MSLRYEIKDDPAVPPGGVAVVVVPGAAAQVRGPMPIDVLISQQDPEVPYLGPSGWQPVEYLWRSGPLRADGDALLVPLGERVTAQIDDYIPLLISFPTLGLSGHAVWRDVTPPSSGWAGSAHEPGRTGGSSFYIEPPIPASPSSAEEEQPPDPNPPRQQAVELPPLPEQGPADTDQPAPKSGPPSRRPLWYALAAVTLFACIAVFIVSSMKEDPSVTPPPSAISTPTQMPPPTPTPPMPEPPRQRQERALAALSSGNIDEAIGILNSLDNEGYGPTLLYLARSLESANFRPGLHRHPNDLAAIQYYQRACAGNERPVALEGLIRLEGELRRRATEGESQAARLLDLQIPKAKALCQ